MNEKIKEKLNSTKNFVEQHKTKILVTTTVVSTTAAVIMRFGLMRHDNFLKEKNLYDEFYTPEDED